MTFEELAQRVQVLMDVSEIKDVTYAYWRSIDAKDPEGLRQVFAPGEIYITYDDMPVWRSRDHFAKSFSKIALDPARQENHFGSSPKIEVTGRDKAVGKWRLNMHGYNFGTRTIMRVTGEYDVEYSRVDGEWKISSLIFKRHSLNSENVLPDGQVLVPDLGGVSPDASMHLFGRDIRGE